MKTAFIDTSYVIALELSSDQHHRAALKHWGSALKSLPLLVTTSYVFDEIVTFFNSRGHHGSVLAISLRFLRSETHPQRNT